MYLSAAILSLISLTSASNLPSPQRLFTNPVQHDAGFTIPTVHESAVQARRILRLESIGTLSTVFPSHHATENRPSVDGAPIGLMDYFGDCEPDTGNPTILAISIATSFKNVDAGSNITLSMRWHPTAHDNVWRSPASLPRFSLLGHLEQIDADVISKASLTKCFVQYHPDAAWWLPGNRIHESKWVRLVVDEVYWIGGFGDRAYIGWIPTKEWYSVTAEEIEAIRLPGEKDGRSSSWKSWLGLREEALEL